jgi:Glyoxalase/Bleomycin resistance protein/Dioxygenase superfamily
MFDFLVSADMLVDDFAPAVAGLQARLGFGEAKAAWYGGGNGTGFEVVFLRTHPRLQGSPTRLEIMAARSLDPAVPAPRTLPHMPGLRAAQDAAPVRTHGTVFAVSDMGDAIERVRRGGFRHWLDAANDLMPHDRLWVGVSEDEKDRWVPGDDGGLLVELVETQSIPGVMESATEPAPPFDPGPAGMTRIAARRWLVPDVDASIERLHATFDCVTGAVGHTVAGSRTAPIVCAHPRSAQVDLMEPAARSTGAALVAAHGPLPWTIVIEVDDLAAKADDLDARGTAFARVTDDVTGADALAPAATQTEGVPFLFVAEAAG